MPGRGSAVDRAAEPAGPCRSHRGAASVMFTDEKDPEDFAAFVPGIFAGRAIDRFLADVLCLIGNALESARDGHKRAQGFERNSIFLPELEKFGID